MIYCCVICLHVKGEMSSHKWLPNEMQCRLTRLVLNSLTFSTPRLIFDIYSITFLNLSLYLYVQFPGNKFTWICQKWVFLKLLLTAVGSNWTQLEYDKSFYSCWHWRLALKLLAAIITVKIHVDSVEFFKWGISPFILPFIPLAHL